MSTETEIAWAAGFIDGEGSFGVQRQKKRKPILYDYRTRSRPNNKPFFYYRLTGDDKAKHAAELLWPYLSEVKRMQFSRSVNPTVGDGSGPENR